MYNVTPCNKIDEPLLVNICSGKRYYTHNNVAYILVIERRRKDLGQSPSIQSDQIVRACG